MALSLFNSQPVLDEPSVLWIFDLFHWSLQQFSSDHFFNATELVVPSNDTFPGRADSVHGKAELIFERVKHFAGVSHWPCQLVEPTRFNPQAPQRLSLQGPLRQASGETQAVIHQEAIQVSYDPMQIRTPEILIANFAHTLAHYMGSQANEAPPGGTENWPQATEVLAVFMGFGLMFANTAFISRSASCGSCQGAVVDRRNYLSQFDITYALAVFCTLKDIPRQAVLPHLKKTLRSYYKKAIKDISSREPELARLKS
jgi:hypothetical protein